MPSIYINENDVSGSDQLFISNIYSGKILGEIMRLQDKSVTITENGTSEVTYDSGYTGLNKVTINTNVDVGQSLNIAYSQTAPTDTSKLWIKASEPENLEIANNLENGVESITSLSEFLSTSGGGMSAHRVGNIIYIFSGSTVQLFNVTTKTLSTLAQTTLTDVRFKASALVDKKVYLFGGVYVNTIQIFDTETNNVTTLSDVTLPTPLGYMSCGVIDKKIYLFGGQVNATTKSVSGVYMFNTEDNSLTTISITNPPVARCMGSVTVNNKIYFFGGKEYESPDFNTIRVFDSETNICSTLTTTLLNAAQGISCCYINNKIYLFGGNSLNTISVFDIASEEIKQITTTLPNGANGIAAELYGNKVYLFGGSNLSTINEFTITFTLQENDIFIQEDFLNNKFNLLSSPTKVELGVKNVYKGNSDNQAELAEAYLYNTTTSQWEQI